MYKQDLALNNLQWLIFHKIYNMLHWICSIKEDIVLLSNHQSTSLLSKKKKSLMHYFNKSFTSYSIVI